MGAIYDLDGEPRYYGFYMGFVVDNVDPLKLGRVTLMIPGLVEPASTWAWPFDTGGGAQNGRWNVPKKGGKVRVVFHQGDIDEPHYFGGWFSRDEAPTPIKGASSADAADMIKCFETDRHLVVLDSRSGAENVLVKDKATGTEIVLKAGEVSVKADQVVVNAGKVILGSDSLLNVAGADGVVLGSGIDTLTGASYGILGSSSRTVLAKK